MGAASGDGHGLLAGGNVSRKIRASWRVPVTPQDNEPDLGRTRRGRPTVALAWSGWAVPTLAPGILDSGQASWAYKTEPGCLGQEALLSCLSPQPLVSVPSPALPGWSHLQSAWVEAQTGRQVGALSILSRLWGLLPNPGSRQCLLQHFTARFSPSPVVAESLTSQAYPVGVCVGAHAQKHILYSHQGQRAWGRALAPW